MILPALQAEVRTWTSASGDRIKAELVEAQGDSVILKNTEGTTFVIQLNKLSRDDQIFVRSAQAPLALNIFDNEDEEPEENPALEELFGSSVINAKKHRTSTSELTGKKIGIYFSAHWCPPCRQFTPKLVDFYNQLKSEDKPFEIVFVSSDRSEREMIGYMKEADMPWLAVRHDSKESNHLKETFSIRSIPTLVVVNDQGTMITSKARGDVEAYGAAAFERW